MVPCEIVRETALRECSYPEATVILPILELPPERGFSNAGDLDAYWERSEWWQSFRVMIDDLEAAENMAKELTEYVGCFDHPRAKELISCLRQLRAPDKWQQTHLQRWADAAMRMPGDLGGGPMKPIIADTLSSLCFGRVLEAMCGFNSYFLPSEKRQVTALDYCRAALERYQYPERERVLVDLDTVTTLSDLDFCGPESFDAISISFGLKYLKNPALVCRALGDMLKPEGRMIFVESPIREYSDLTFRRFDLDVCERILREAGLSISSSRLLGNERQQRIEQVYLVEAVKG